MGIIQRQALRSSIANYIGVAFGACTRLVLAIFASDAAIGVIDMLDSVVKTFSMIFTFGYNQVLIRIFPKYRNEDLGHAGFLLFGLFLSLFGVLIGLCFYYLFFDFWTPKDPQTDAVMYLQLFVQVVPFVILFQILFKNLDGYARILFATVFGTVLESIVLKGIIVTGVLLTFFQVLVFEDLLYVYVLALSLPGIVVTIFAFMKTKKVVLPKKQMLQENKKQIPSLMLFGVLVGASSTIIISVDRFMLNEMVGTEAVGVYGQMAFAAILVSMVSRGVKRISVTVLAESWNANERTNIADIYRKSCLNQMLIAFFILIVGWACIGPATELLGKYEEATYVFLFLGLGQLFEMMTGVNAEIIGTSSYYKYNTYFNLTLAFLVIVFNYIFISLWEIEGAAFASALAVVLVNIIRWLFLYRKFEFQPFDGRFLLATLPGVVLMLAISFLPIDLAPAYQIMVYFLAVTVIYWSIVIGLGLSEEINDWLRKILKIRK